MLMDDDIKPAIEVLVPYAVSNEAELIQLVFETIEERCRGYEVSSLDMYETLFNKLVAKAKEVENE